jgi:hypothetical protein
MQNSINRRDFMSTLASSGTAGVPLLSFAGRSANGATGTHSIATPDEANRNTIPARERRDIIVYKDRFAYCSHACIARLANGEWIAAFNECQLRKPHTHPPSDPHFHNLLTRSDDQGKTWSTPQVVPGWEWYGVECPGLAQLKDGTVILNQWQFLWHPLDIGRKLTAQGKQIWLNTGKGWRIADKNADWSSSRYPWVRSNGGCYVHRSSDGGRTWDQSVRIETRPYVGGYTPRGVVQLSGGTVLMCTADHPLNRHAFVVHSPDGGKTWSKPILMGRKGDEDFSESAAAVLPSGRVVTLIRNDDTRHLHQIDSADRGRTWGRVRKTPIWGYPAHLLVLSDGQLLATYGHRRKPFGIRACLGRNGGQNWAYGSELVIRDDLPNGNLGYPVTIEYQPGRLFTIYYGEDSDGVTCIHGSYWKLS